MRPGLAALARQIERHMTCPVRAVTITRVLDRETGAYVDQETVQWSGKGHVRPTSSKSVFAVAGGQSVGVKTYEVWLPVGTSFTADTLIASPLTGDLKLTIVDRPRDDWATSARFLAQHVE